MADSITFVASGCGIWWSFTRVLPLVVFLSPIILWNSLLELDDFQNGLSSCLPKFLLNFKNLSIALFEVCNLLFTVTLLDVWAFQFFNWLECNRLSKLIGGQSHLICLERSYQLMDFDLINILAFFYCNNFRTKYFRKDLKTFLTIFSFGILSPRLRLDVTISFSFE